MIYTTKKCPRCGKVLEQSAGYSDDLNNHIGNPIAACVHCGTEYGTGKKYWSDMTGPERQKIYWSLITGAIVGGLKIAVLLGCGLGAIYVFGFKGDSKSTPMSNSAVLGLWVLLYIVGLSYVARSKLKSLAHFQSLGGSNSSSRK